MFLQSATITVVYVLVISTALVIRNALQDTCLQIWRVFKNQYEVFINTEIDIFDNFIFDYLLLKQITKMSSFLHLLVEFPSCMGAPLLGKVPI